MTTVLAVYTSDGCVGRCDANCHDAKHSVCTCICGSRNHGKGLEAAIENTKEMIGLTEEDLKKFAETHHRDVADLTVIDRVQLPKATHARKQAKQRIEQPELFTWKGEETAS